MMAFFVATLRASFFSAADNGDKELFSQKWDRKTDIDRRALPSRILGSLMNSFLLLVRKGVQHPFGQSLEKPCGRRFSRILQGHCVGGKK